LTVDDALLNIKQKSNQAWKQQSAGAPSVLSTASASRCAHRDTGRESTLCLVWPESLTACRRSSLRPVRRRAREGWAARSRAPRKERRRHRVHQRRLRLRPRPACAAVSCVARERCVAISCRRVSTVAAPASPACSPRPTARRGGHAGWSASPTTPLPMPRRRRRRRPTSPASRRSWNVCGTSRALSRN
jgi:hypothetical protein